MSDYAVEWPQDVTQTLLMSGENSEKKIVKTRISVSADRLLNSMTTSHRTTKEDLFGAVLEWFCGLPDDQQRRIVSGLSDDAVLRLADDIRRARAEAVVEALPSAPPVEPASPPAFRRHKRSRGA